MAENEDAERDSPIQLGLAGTGTSLTKSAGLALGGGTLVSVAMELGIYPETITLAGKTIHLQGPMVMAYVGAAGAWAINFVRKFIMRHSG